MRKIISYGLVLTALLSGCTPDQEQDPVLEPETEEPEETNDEESVEVFAENLDVPWSIEMVEDIVYITERSGTLVTIEDGNVDRQEVELEEEVSTASEAGFMGFVLSPDFPESDEAYAYYTYESDEGQFNRIVLLEREDNIWRESQVLLDHIPSGTVHHGGRLLLGSDDRLYTTTGDAAEPDIAQDLDSLGGKILRLNLDGSVPEDNLFSDSYVYSYGHRNPQGLAWSTEEVLYSSEHGDTANDEINLIEPGENYGRPVIEGEEEQEGMVSPLFTSGQDNTWAPSGMAYHDNHLYVSALRGNAVIEFDLQTDEERELFTEFGRIRDVYIDEGYLYFITNNLDGRGSPTEGDDRLYRMLLSDI
ncbi:sorbosone dehydrogenase family protein [Marinilactibacillus psychrotolerans]|uniref:Sorbosone dehydrogenase family protein n=1 Tax=Marinilactibacillus psychrotolerans TaxID=191770 RepID=A0A5R9C799_9LACT|nr:sorbosone dehydrogenase family protein [Marinilactibacillus psychrotolerans]TLQ08990.1 sorbosone dehydrogenase family protein [Marinilactibacillus psychrotolerans]